MWHLDFSLLRSWAEKQHHHPSILQNCEIIHRCCFHPTSSSVWVILSPHLVCKLHTPSASSFLHPQTLPTWGSLPTLPIFLHNTIGGRETPLKNPWRSFQIRRVIFSLLDQNAVSSKCSYMCIWKLKFALENSHLGFTSLSLMENQPGAKRLVTIGKEPQRDKHGDREVRAGF